MSGLSGARLTEAGQLQKLKSSLIKNLFLILMLNAT